MDLRGRVQNGVVVLEDGKRLPEGQDVTVLVRDECTAEQGTEGVSAHSVLDIATVSLVPLLPFSSDNDLLGEMLEGRT